MPEHVPPAFRTSVLTPLNRRGRAAEVERRLAEAIELGAFTEGEQLPSEAALASQLGVAVVTLRDALASLREAGFLETRRGHGGGSFVIQPQGGLEPRLVGRLSLLSVDELRDLGDMRAAVSASAARLAAERATERDLERLGLFVDDLVGAATVRGRRLADRRFHIELAAATGSLQLTRAESRLQNEVGSLLLLLSAQPDAAGDDHRGILDAVRAGDADAADARMRAHVGGETAALVERRGRAAIGSPERSPVAAPTDAVAVLEAAIGGVFARLERARLEVERAVGVAAGERRCLRDSDLSELHAFVEQALLGPDGLLGMGVAFGSEASSDVRWAWWQLREGGPAALSVVLDPRHPEFYDFATAEWFAAPMRSGSPAVTGPFIDSGGADEHIFTLALPVAGAGGAPVGVVGADVPVRHVEAVVAPALGATGGATAVVTPDGLVVASSTSAWLPGTRWTPPPSGGVQRVRSEVLGWSVVSRP